MRQPADLLITVTLTLSNEVWLIRIVILGSEPVWLYEVLHEITVLARLPANWDSYGGRPLDGATAVAAIRLLAQIMGDDSPAPSVVPTSLGGIQLEWHRGEIDLEIQIDPEEKVDAWYHSRTTGEEWEGEENLEQELIRYIRELGSHTKQQ